MAKGDVIREYNAMHEENFFGSWLREGHVDKEQRRKKVKERVREEKREGKEKKWRGKKRTRR